MSYNPFENADRKNTFNGKLKSSPGSKENPLALVVQTKTRAKEVQKQVDDNHLFADIIVDAKKEEDIKDLTILLTPVQPYVAQKLPGRNEPCHCGSGKKFKHCHGSSNPPAKSSKASTAQTKADSGTKKTTKKK